MSVIHTRCAQQRHRARRRVAHDDASESVGHEFVPQLVIEGINVTEEKRRSNFQFTNAMFSEFDSGRVIMVGLRGSF